MCVGYVCVYVRVLKELFHVFVGTGNSEIHRAGSGLETQVEVDGAVLRQNFFSEKPQFLFSYSVKKIHPHY